VNVAMAARPVPSRRAHRLVGLSIAALVVANGVAVYVVGSRVTPVTVDTAVARFRALTQPAPGTNAVPDEHGAAPAAVVGVEGASAAAVVAAGPAASSAPAPSPTSAPASTSPGTAVPRFGVYVYATSGSEDVSVAGAHHTYPDQTTMTIAPGPCGLEVRWDVFEERWDRWTLCTTGHQIELRQFETYHEFFGQVEHRTYDCAPGTDFRPERSDPSTRTSGRCESGGAVVDLTTTVVAIEEVTVGGDAVPAVHVRVDEVLSGDTRGTRSSDSWYGLADGLLLRRTAVTEVDTESVFGSTHYSEELRLDLTSLEPRS